MKEGVLELFIKWTECQNFFGKSFLTKGADCDNKSVRVDVEAIKFISRITYWSSGEYCAEILDLINGETIYWKYGACVPDEFSSEFSDFLKILEGAAG